MFDLTSSAVLTSPARSTPRTAVSKIGKPGIRLGRANATFEIAPVRLAQQLGLIHKQDELQRFERPLFVASRLRGVK